MEIQNQKATKRVLVSLYILIITLNGSGMNLSKGTLASWTKNKTQLLGANRKYTSVLRMHRRLAGMGKLLHASRNCNITSNFGI